MWNTVKSIWAACEMSNSNICVMSEMVMTQTRLLFWSVYTSFAASYNAESSQLANSMIQC